jgi:hypothetical protein
MQKTEKASWKTMRTLALGIGVASLLTLPLTLEARLRQATQPLTDRWQRVPIEPRRSTLLGLSFRTPQVIALGLDARTTLHTLLTYPFHIIRLGAYWNRIELEPGSFYPDELDWQIDAAEQAGKQIILCVGPLKTFGYPEFFVPANHLKRPFPEHIRVTPSAYSPLLTAATGFITRLVERYKQRQGIVAWQLEHEAVDPLGIEHTWRLDVTFVKKEVEALRKADPTRPIMMNGFLPASLPVLLSQWWRTRDQGDSLAAAQRMADIVGIDYYPRHALMTVGTKNLYLDGSQSLWLQRRQRQLSAWAHKHGQQLMISEGQAEPWETITIPPSPQGQGLYSCLPEHIITNYNTCMRWSKPEAPLYAYLFWGAEYWILRKQCADASYLQAFARILEHA